MKMCGKNGQITFLARPEFIREVKIEAVKRDLSLSAATREALRLWLDRIRAEEQRGGQGDVCATN